MPQPAAVAAPRLGLTLVSTLPPGARRLALHHPADSGPAGRVGSGPVSRAAGRVGSGPVSRPVARVGSGAARGPVSRPAGPVGSGAARGLVSRPVGRVSAAELAARTPASRDRTVDALRVASIAVVVLGHWLMATVTVGPDGTVAAGNALTALPGLAHLTWLLQVVPVFFLVGGFGHARALRPGRSYADFARGRAARLLRPAVAFVAVATVAAVLLGAAGLDRGVVAVALRTLPQPLWFVGVYLGVVALAPAMWHWHRRHGAAVPVLLAAGAAAVDLVRFGAGVPAVGALNVALVWLAVHQLGFFLADGRLTRRVGAALAVAGGGALVLLTTAGPYPVSMVGLPGYPVSNVNPPTLALLAQAVALTGLVALARPALARSLQDSRVWTVVVAANGVVMTVFLWHLTALFALVALLVRAGVALPAAGTPAWLLSRPLWIAALAVLLVPLVAAARAAERPRAVTAGRAATATAAAGLAAATVGVLGLSAVGLSGVLSGHTATLVVLPLTAPVALVLLAAGLLALRR